jgi:peptidoglycan L-alanyl-D-glutamate endopeptidase CwlK
MPQFGPRSLERLNTCHPDLQRVMRAAIASGPDFSIICGHRGKAEQDEACAKGLSKTPFPTSKHNAVPSLAVDIAPYPIDWKDEARFVALARHVLAVAAELGVKLRWGGDWDGDGMTRSEGDTDERFVDLPHFELRG